LEERRETEGIVFAADFAKVGVDSEMAAKALGSLVAAKTHCCCYPDDLDILLCPDPDHRLVLVLGLLGLYPYYPLYLYLWNHHSVGFG